MSAQVSECKHNVVYAGAINLIRGFGIVGAVDAWTCTLCSELWCDEKRIEHQELPPEVGLPPRKTGTEWLILFCEDGSKMDWNLVQARKGEEIDHSCKVFESCQIQVNKDYGATCKAGHQAKHRFFPVRQNLNRAIYV
ncbi:MAG: hypothetical protein QXX17_03545 [Conexivisphaerales archaeon]